MIYKLIAKWWLSDTIDYKLGEWRLDFDTPCDYDSPGLTVYKSAFKSLNLFLFCIFIEL